MKFSLSTIDAARSNPQRYGERQAAAAEAGKKGGYNANNFRTYFAHAIRGYHNQEPWADLIKEFSRKSRSKLSHLNHFAQRLAQYEKTLQGYFSSYPTQGVFFVEMAKEFTLGIGRHIITGKVDRLDRRNPRGYRATEIQINKAPWRRKLRWPIIQHALSEELGSSLAEVEVGVHCFETGDPDYHFFSHKEIEAALAEAEDICDELAGYGKEPDIDDL